MNRTRFEFAPPPVPFDGTGAVPIDIQEIFARLRFDPLLGDSLDATVTFVTGQVAGYPVFDLRQTSRQAWLDGRPLRSDCLRHHDLGGGTNAEMRVIERNLPSGTEHTLRVIADLGPQQVPMQKNRLPKLEWEAGSRHRRIDTENRLRRGGRAADCAALEMLCGGNLTGGSNPPLSARIQTPFATA